MGLRRSRHVAWRRIGEETVLMDLKLKKVYLLNPSGTFFWHLVDGARGAGEMIDLLPAPPASDGLPQVASFLTRLETEGLLEPTDAPADALPIPTYPLPAFVPPELIWEEQIRSFGFSCAF